MGETQGPQDRGHSVNFRAEPHGLPLVEKP